MGRPLAAVLLALGVAVPLLAQPAAARTAPVPAPAPAPGGSLVGGRAAPEQPRILVHFRPDVSDAERSAAIGAVGGIVDRVIDGIGIVRVALPIAATEDATGLAALRLARDATVVSVEPDSTGRVQFAPNDPFYLTDPSFGLGQWGIRKTHVDQAWDVVRGSPSIVVAVIDTGIDANHPDLAGAIVPGTTFVTSPDPTCAPGSTIDDNGHGTHVAGLIGANGNNGVGIAGVAFGVKILPIKALDCQGSGLLSDVASGIVWATDHGARIINISLGSSSAQSTLQDAIRYALAHNVLVVAAAGNCGVASTRCTTVNEPQYPGAYPESFAVAATDSNDVRAPFSNSNAYVAIAAPGARIWSTTPTYPTTLSRNAPGTSSYAAFSGTSQASPFVAGVAALLLSKDPALTPAQLADRLRSTADDLGLPGTDPDYGAGRVNALRAASAVAGIASYGVAYGLAGLPARAFTQLPITAPVQLTNTSNFAWPAAGPNPVRLGYHWTDLSGAVVVWDGQRTALPADVPIGGQVTVNATVPTPPAPGTYLLKMDLVREGITWFSAGSALSLPVTVVVANGLAASYAPATGAPSTFVLGPNAFGVVVTNTGAAAWPSVGANPVHLSYHWIAADGSVAVWDGARASLPTDIAPGQGAVVSLTVQSPPTIGSYTLRLDLVQEGVAWFSGRGVLTRDVAINVTNGFGASYAVTAPATSFLPGSRALLPVTLTNTGLLTWTAGGANPVRVAAHVYDSADGLISWDGERASLPADVAPGQSVTVAVPVAVPVGASAARYVFRVDLVREGLAWFSSYGVAPQVGALGVVADYRASFSIASSTVSRSAPAVTVTITDAGQAPWLAGGAAPIDVGSHWLAADGSALVWDGPRVPLGQAVAPGGSVTVTLPLAPPPPGAASLVVDLVAEGLRWFGSGSPRPVTLVP